MSTPSGPTRPDADSLAERRANDASTRLDDAPAGGPVAGPLRQEPSGLRDDDPFEPEREGYGPGPSDRAADLLIDIPQGTVEELAIELDASHTLNRVKLDAKGLDAGVLLTANLDALLALEQRGSDRSDTASGSPRGSDVVRVPSGLRELLGATRVAYRHRFDRNGDDRRTHAARERLRHVAGQGAKAAGLTAAGLAGGALLESRSKVSRKLPLPRRRNRAQVMLREISRRLP